MHHFGHFDPAALAEHPIYTGHSDGYRLASLVDDGAGSVHTGLSIAELAPGGTLAPHVHSYEESFYVLSGEAIVGINDQAYRVGPGDLGALKVGTVHGWRAAGSAAVRWLQMAAPQPKPLGKERDTFFVTNGSVAPDGARLNPTRADGNLLGHFDVRQIPDIKLVVRDIRNVPAIRGNCDSVSAGPGQGLAFWQYVGEARD